MMKVSSGLVLLFGALQETSALALPQTQSRPSTVLEPKKDTRSRCAKNDVSILTKDNWNDKKVTDWFHYWETNALGTTERTDWGFSSYWGQGRISCLINQPCEAPLCSELNRPDQKKDYEQAEMVFASMANFNNFCAQLYSALDGAQIDWNTMQIAIQQTYYPGVNTNNLLLDALNALTAVVGIAVAWLGPVRVAVGVGASATSFKEVFASIARGFSKSLTSADMSLKILAENARTVESAFTTARESLVHEHDNILQWGTSYASTGLGGAGSMDNLFDGGAWVNKADIAALNGDVSVEEARDYFKDMIFAMVINHSWKEQGVYIFSQKMSKEDCEANNNVDTPKLCANDRIYWLNKYVGFSWMQAEPGVTSPPGVDKLKDDLGFTVQDAMRSALDAFYEGGYKFDAASVVDAVLLDPAGPNISSRGRFKGIYNIPVCEVESSDQYDDMVSKAKSQYGESETYITKDLAKNYRNGDSQHGMHACLCYTAHDPKGVSMRDIKDYGDKSFYKAINNAGKCHLGKYDEL